MLGPLVRLWAVSALWGPTFRNNIVIFLGDILVYSKDVEAHVAHVRQALQILRHHQLYAKVTKCAFFQSSVEYLGHIVSAYGLPMDPIKEQAVQD